MKLKEITFVFENCDTITIDGKYIGNFLVQDLDVSIMRIACNAINRMDIAKTIVIEIHKDANKEHKELGCDEWVSLVFERLQSPDVTAIHFDLIEDCTSEIPKNEHYEFYVNWTGDSETNNEAQKTYVSKQGNLYIVIADGKSVEDFFNKEDIDDKEYMDLITSMYNIGDKNKEN